MRKPTAKPIPLPMLDGDIVLTDDDIAAMGLKEAPDDIGPSWLEIMAARQKKEVGHG
jgi:hypothetical protein